MVDKEPPYVVIYLYRYICCFNFRDKPHDLSSYYKKVSEYKSYLLSIIPDGRKPIQIPPAPVDG